MNASVPAAAVQHAHYTEAVALLSATPGVVMQVTPLRHDGFYVDLTTMRLGDVVLVRGACSPLLLVAAQGPATVALQFPMDAADTLVLNGRILPAFGFCLYGPGAHLVRSNTRDSTYAVLVMPPEVAEFHLAAEDGRPPIGPGEHIMRTARPEDWTRMAQLIRSAAHTAREAPDVFATAPPRLALRSSLLGVARDLVVHAERAARTGQRRSPEASTRLVLGVEEYLNAHLERPIYTEELCRVLAVSSSTLAEAFHCTVGISPHRYLKLRRLNMVRAALLGREQPRQLVKSVALSYGFWHLGQFALDYREHFGESPSATLAGANCSVPPEAIQEGYGAEADGERGYVAERAVLTR